VTIASDLRASVDGADADTKATAERLARFDEMRTERADRHKPDEALPVDPEWSALFADVTSEGMKLASRSHITICGMARNIAGILPVTFVRLAEIVKHFKDYAFAFVENDSTDDTKAMLKKFEQDNLGRVALSTKDYGWPHLHGWEPERVQRYATLRNTYREMARESFPQTNYVLAVDLDCWGGWSVPGLLNGIGWLERHKDAACMASTSLFQAHVFPQGPSWCHYDTWALRVHGWTHKLEPWKTLWLPPPGSPPVKVFSAFGAGAIYRPEALWAHPYRSIDGDIEHAGLHRSMIDAGWSVYLNPSQRSLMHWLTEEQGGGVNGND
jgi:hypothetical protein